MANKKILYTDSIGILKELSTASGTYYDDSISNFVTGTFYAKNINFNTMSFSSDGIIQVLNGTASIIQAKEFDVLSWDSNTKKGWTYVNGQIIDVTADIPGQPAGTKYTASSNADISGTLDNPYPKSLMNVRSGSLKILNGGTGLYSGSEGNRNDFAGLSGEYILTGSTIDKLGFLTASQITSAVALVSNGTSWDYITQSVNNAVEVSVFTASGVWTKPEGTKAVRVIVQGGGGGGGAGGNFNSITASVKGGAGGAAGGVVDKYLGNFTYDTASITVGVGGFGGLIEDIGIFNGSGSDGGSSSFGTFVSSIGGKGGLNGNLITSSGGFNFLTNSSPIYLDVYNFKNINYNGLSGMSGGDYSGSNSLYTKNIYSAGGASGGGSLGSSSTDATSGLVSSNDVVFQLKFNSDGSATNLIDNGIIVSSYTNQSLKYVSDTWNPFQNSYDYEYSVYNPAPATNLAYYGISTGSRALEGDFTFEINVYLTDLGSSNYLPLITLFPIDTSPTNTSAGSYYTFSIDNDGSIKLFSNSSATVHETAAAILSINTSYHLALVRKNGYFSVFVNGQKIPWSSGGTSKHDLVLYFQRLLGVQGTSLSFGFYGYATNARLTKKALYVSAFNPPESRYEIDYRNNIGANALSSSVTSSNLLNLQEQNFSNSSHIKNIFKGTGGGGGSSACFDSDNYSIVEPVSSSAVFVLDGLRDYYGQFTREMISNTSLGFTGSCSITTTSPARPSGSFIFSDIGGAINGMYFSQNRNIGTGDFTVETWVRISNTTKNHLLFDFRASPYTYGGIYMMIVATTAKLQLAWNSGGPATYVSTASIPINTWTHVAMVRQSGITYFYINGTLDGSSAGFSTAIDNNTLQNSYIGYAGYSPTLSRILVGYMDRIRIYKSAIYTSNFTPSTNLYKDYTVITSSYLGGVGGDGVYGSGGGGGGSNLNATGSSIGLRQGGNGGNGYVAVISYKY